MPTTRKILGQSAPAAATPTTLYLVPAATSTVVSSIVVCNTSQVQATFRVAVRPTADALAVKHYLYFDHILPGGTTFTATLGTTLGAAELIEVQASAATISFSAFGEETA